MIDLNRPGLGAMGMNRSSRETSIDALKITLTQEDVRAIEAAIPEAKVRGRGMRNFVFTNGRTALA